MKKLWLCACLFIAFTSLAHTTLAQTPILVDAGDIPPFSHELEGQASGIAVELLTAAARSKKLPIEFRFLPWLRAQNDVITNPNRLIIPLTRAPERETQYNWLTELFRYRFVLIGLDAQPPRSLQTAKNLRIGVLRGNPAEGMLRAQGFKLLDVGTSEQINARKLLAHRIDLWVAADLAAPSIFKQIGGDPARLRVGQSIGPTRKIYLAASPTLSDPAILDLAQAIDKLKSTGEAQRIVNRYR
ncbi:ABC transporter substrate-binding protein [Chromobacterium sp. IIBBL 290-4]|uniref:substrate-binding periplasmic protein n=1 Tax=Chromobacterium sp. IIBBL 290-4 TaxID=2953890 RepID=UPI0020B6C057|nr:transporter substrate-binding domain-containing protein [Chromobacterium sp. IIBBL 290-4]UTH73775.1 transporter substrate-binding domain-containing protein [Chromobacterium sp. IIBBL 290-4]